MQSANLISCISIHRLQHTFKANSQRESSTLKLNNNKYEYATLCVCVYFLNRASCMYFCKRNYNSLNAYKCSLIL